MARRGEHVIVLGRHVKEGFGDTTQLVGIFFVGFVSYLPGAGIGATQRE